MAEHITVASLLESLLDKVMSEKDLCHGSMMTTHEGTLHITTPSGQGFIITVKEG